MLRWITDIATGSMSADIVCALIIWAVCQCSALSQQPSSSFRIQRTDSSELRLLAPPTNEASKGDLPSKNQQTTRLIGQHLDRDRIERLLKTILRNRLKVRADETQRVYDFVRDGRTTATLIFDDRRAGILVQGSSTVLEQFEILSEALSRLPDESQQRTAVLSIERTDRNRLQRAIEAYRQGTGRPAADASSDARRARLQGGLALANFVLQDDPTRPSNANAQKPEVQNAVTPGDLDVDVEIQTLPDLDVIILRGRDRDVSKLTQIIQELERLSRETQPRIQVIPLQHANSAAVTEVLVDVNEDLTGRRQGRVSATALEKPNSILLIGWGDAVQAMIELIRQLDTPVAADSRFRVFRLKHAPAVSVVSTITQFFASRQGLEPRIQSVADQRSNSVIASGAPRDLDEVERLVQSLDTPQSESIRRARVIPIKHVLASDIAETLSAAIQASTGQGVPSAILELMTIDGQGEKLIRSGILSDVRITPNVRNNSIILSGPSESFSLLEMLIQQLDVPGAVSQIKVFRIVNGDAANLVRMLRSLLPSEAGAASDVQLPSAEGETSLAPLRFSVDTRTNTIIAAGTEGDLRIIEALLLRLDEQDLAERKNEVFRLNNAPALDVATAINEFLRSERVVQQAAPGTESPFEQIEREVVVVPEPVGNSLIISATPRYFDEIRKLVSDLDAKPPQVLIQVLIAEVNLNDSHEFGVELGIQDSVLFDRSLLGDLVTTVRTTQTSTPAGIVTTTEELIQAATNDPGFDFNNMPLGNSGSTKALQNSNQVGTQGLTSFAVGRLNNELGFGGLVLSASSESVSVLIRALQESRRLDVLSRPQVRTLDNQPAFIQVGQRVPRIVASNITEGGLQTNSVELENVGLIMGVTPRISPDGTVVMEIDAEKSSLGPEQEGIPITVSLDGTIIRSPRIDTTTAQATVSAASGETIILGGLITNGTQSVNRRVPYLSDLPLLGDLFRYDGTFQRRTELLIILTPHVIRSAEDSERLKQSEMARMTWCAADVYRVHGDIDTIVDSVPLMDETTPVIYPHVDPRGEGLIPPDPSPGLDVSEGPGGS
jgi:type II secretion system protein D